MNYLLLGAEFNNKGAEAMTLTALKNIYENDSNACVFLIESGKFPSFELNKKLNYFNRSVWNLLIQKNKFAKKYYKQMIKEFIKIFLPWKKSQVKILRYSKKKLEKIKIVIDISGFAFSSKWGDDGAIDWLCQIDFMEKMDARIYLMPQSFGPFDFKSKSVIEYGKAVLEKCEIIYAREAYAFNLLNNLGLKNVKRQNDSVLIEKPFNLSFLIKDYERYKENITVSKGHNVAIIPNYRLLDKGKWDCEELINFYINIINKYIETHTFFLIAHAGEDLPICRKIKERINSEKVILVDHVMFSFNYQSFIKKMDFIIASRYHAIIHAYKENTPSVVLGWSQKYNGICSEMNQTDYLIDLNDQNTCFIKIDKMAKLYEYESNNIKNKMEILRNTSCYGFLKTIQIANGEDKCLVE